MAWHNKFQLFFSCLIVFISGSFTQSVDLTVDKPIPITEGERLRFTCQITGSPRLVTYAMSETGVIVSWKVQNNSCSFFVNPDTALYNASCDGTNSLYHMDILNITSAGYHNFNITCEAQFGTDKDDTIEGFIYMQVNVPLTAVSINTTSNITVQEDQHIQTSCTARSRPLPQFSWFISERQITDMVQTVNDIEVTSTVRYHGNRTDNNQPIYCKVNSGEIELTSSSVYLNVTYPPDISLQLNNNPVEGMRQYNLSCMILDSNPMANTFRWQIGSMVINNQQILTLNNLNRNNSDNYTCYASNGIGNETSDTVFLDVLYKGSILNFNTGNTTIREGGTFMADVEVEGKPLPNVTWSYHRTSTILVRDDSVNSSSLNMSVMCEHTGNYSCTVDNGLVEPDVQNFRLTIFCSPRVNIFESDTEAISIENGLPLSLKAAFIAYPEPNITWFFNNQTMRSLFPTNQYNTLPVHINTSSDESIHESTLSISKVNSTYNGQISVIAENIYGREQRVFSINVIDPSSITSGINEEAVVGGVAGAVVFLLLVVLVIQAYRKKKKREKQRQRSWRASSRDIDDIIKENGIEEAIVEPIEPVYTSSSGHKHLSTSQIKVDLSERHSHPYATVEKRKITEVSGPEFKVAEFDDNTKF